VSIRPSVLCNFYRASGDLLRTRALANHANIATTVRYVEVPVVRRHNHVRIAALQEAFIEHLTASTKSSPPVAAASPPSARLPSGELVSMFGFDCKDPLAGTAPGTRQGELCTNFMGCFTCPNAVIAPEPLTVARLLQARDHLRAAAATLKTELHCAAAASLCSPAQPPVVPSSAPGNAQPSNEFSCSPQAEPHHHRSRHHSRSLICPVGNEPSSAHPFPASLRTRQRVTKDLVARLGLKPMD